MIDIGLLISKRKGSVLVDTTNIRTGVLFRNAAILKNSNSWHAFILRDVGQVERNDILKIVLDHLYPLDLIPVKFELRNNDCIFMARNCTEAIEKLCKDNLMISNPADVMAPIRCEIILHFSTLQQLKVDVQKNISAVLQTLYNPGTRTMNLNNFAENPDLNEYCPLSQPKIMYFVLHMASGMHPVNIKLTNNNIHSLFPIEALWSSTTLKQLDLSNNKIDSLSSLDSLKMLNLTELWLDGNPVCSTVDERSYVEQIRQILTKLEKLDGIEIIKHGIPAFKKNSLCDREGFDLVDQFLEYFFPLYDSDRMLLEGLYDPKAMCSITNLYKSGQNSSNGARLRPYQMNSRNLLVMADLSRGQQFLIKGNSSIVRKLADLPATEHDPYSFNVDLIYYSKTCAVINVTGIFREIPEALLEVERYLGFCRTFVLNYCSKGQYSIANDMLHVYNALTHQSSTAFVISKPMKQEIIPKLSTYKDKEKAIQAVELITGVSKDWSRRLLEDANYDMVDCIKAFVELFKVDKIPVEAFKK